MTEETLTLLVVSAAHFSPGIGGLGYGIRDDQKGPIYLLILPSLSEINPLRIIIPLRPIIQNIIIIIHDFDASIEHLAARIGAVESCHSEAEGEGLPPYQIQVNRS